VLRGFRAESSAGGEGEEPVEAGCDQGSGAPGVVGVAAVGLEEVVEGGVRAVGVFVVLVVGAVALTAVVIVIVSTRDSTQVVGVILHTKSLVLDGEQRGLVVVLRENVTRDPDGLHANREREQERAPGSQRIGRQGSGRASHRIRDVPKPAWATQGWPSQTAPRAHRQKPGPG